MEQIKEQMKALWNKIKENKEQVIRIGVGVAGALIGAAVTAAILSVETVDEDEYVDSVELLEEAVEKEESAE